jgi:2-dehydropantoate 2-reductase
VGPQTTIALLQNGIEIEDEYAAIFLNNPLLSGVVHLPVTQTAPGEIRMGEIELLELGTYPANAPEAHNARAAEFVEVITKGGGTRKTFDDIQPRRW